jgi:hypothetical protein
MGFPTSDEIASFSNFLRLSGIRDMVVSARPELKNVTSAGSTAGNALTIELPAHPAGSHNRVVLGQVRSHHVTHWLLGGPRPHGLVTSAWELDTEEEYLRDAVLATYDACLAKSEVPSPWRWAEPTPTFVVQVADALADAGIAVDAVASSNRLVPDPSARDDESKTIPPSFGDALRVELEWGTATLAHKPSLGWVLDANDRVITRRLDLGLFATGGPSVAPGCATDDPAALAKAVARGVREGRWDSLEGQLRHSGIVYSNQPLLYATAWWMRELGYPLAEVVDFESPRVISAQHVVTAAKRCGLGDVQRAFAQATVEDKALVMFATGGYTRDAVKWADKAHLPLFNLWADQYQLSAASSLAEEHIPKVI